MSQEVAEFREACAKGAAAMDPVLRRLDARHRRRLEWEARRVVGAIDAVEDLAQQALNKAWIGCRDFDGRSGVLAWLIAIVRNLALDHLRADKRRPSEVSFSDEDEAALHEAEAILQRLATGPGADPERRALQSDAKRVYDECMGRLEADHPAHATLLRLIAERELTPAEAAAHEGRSSGAVRTQMSEARKLARIYLLPWYRLLKS